MIPQRRRCGLRVLLLTFALVGLTGCSGQYPVTGKVTLDGTPVDGGVISFTPKEGGEAGGKATPKGGPIVAGKYTQALPPGSYRVDINWPKKTGRKVGTPGDPEVLTDETSEAIPSIYNSASTLTADVKAGSTTFDYNLTSQGQSPQQQPGGRAPAKGD